MRRDEKRKLAIPFVSRWTEYREKDVPQREWKSGVAGLGEDNEDARDSH